MSVIDDISMLVRIGTSIASILGGSRFCDEFGDRSSSSNTNRASIRRRGGQGEASQLHSRGEREERKNRMEYQEEEKEQQYQQ